MARDAAAEPVDAVVLCGSRHADTELTGLLDDLVPCAHLLGRVLILGESGKQQDHPLFVRHGVERVEVAPGPDPPLTRTLRAGQGVGRWWWLLDADTRLAGDALMQLLDVVRRSSRVGIVGPKLVDRDQPRTVVGVGHRVTRWGRSLDAVDSGAWDQGQFDERSDVIGVPLTGMLIRTDVITAVGGLDPAFDPAVAGLDISWRAHLVGQRVLVAPGAVVATARSADGWSGAYGYANSGGRRLGALAFQRALLALARGPLWRVPGRSAAMLVTSLVTMLSLLMLRSPRAATRAGAEARAVLWPWAAYAARWRFRGKAEVGESDLAGLFATDRARRQGVLPYVADGSAARRLAGMQGEGQLSSRARTIGAIEAGPVSDEAGSVGDDAVASSRRWWSWPLAAAVVLTVAASVARWRDLGLGLAPSGWGVQGAELRGVAADPGQIWAAWSLPWSGAGLGQAEHGAPWLMPMSGWTWILEQVPGGPDSAHAAAVGTAWLLGSAMVLSLLTAYTATGVITDSRSIRGILALGWAGAAPLMSGLDAGRLGPVVVHVLAPWIVASVILSRRSGPRGTTAAFALGLLCGFAAWWVPVLAVLAWGPALVILIGAHGWARLRAVPIALLPALLLGPELLRLAAEPLLMLGGAGATDTGAAAMTAWQALLLHAGGPLSIGLWWIAPAWVLALVATLGLDRSTTGGLALSLSVAALLGVAVAVGTSRLQLGVLPNGYLDAGLPVTVWPGTFLSLAGAALLFAAGLGASDLSRRNVDEHSGHRRGAQWNLPRGSAPRSALGVLVLAVAVAGVVGTLALTALRPTGPDLSVAAEPVPAVVAERAAGPDGVRLIELTPEPVPTGPDGRYAVTYALSGVEPAAWVRDRTRDLVREATLIESSAPPVGSGDPLEALVTDLVDTTEPTMSGQNSSDVESALADLAVGYVALDAAQDHPLVAHIEAIPSLTRVSAQGGGQLWRVLPEVAGTRVWSESTQDRRDALPVAGLAAQTSTELPTEAELVGVAESGAWAATATVTLDDVELRAEPGFPVRYAVPSGGGTLVIDVPMEHERWWWGTAALGVITTLLALPIVRSSTRRSR